MEYDLTDINTVRSLLRRHGFTFKHSLGQNFIVDPEICPRIAEASGVTKNSGVIEIGAGVGVLTAELCKRAGKVVTFEVDAGLLPVLADTLSEFKNVAVINSDIMKTDLKKVIAEELAGYDDIRVCANLPYYITSPVIMLLLEGDFGFSSMTFMVQKEAAQRLAAPVGSREAGAVTVAVDYRAKAEKLFDVGKNSFMPSPKVDSAVVRMDIRTAPEFAPNNEKLFFRMVRAAFSQRRKTAANGISAGLGMDKGKVISALNAADLNENVRAEKLTMEELVRLADELTK
ncbi:MAG: 16S rRNA (adenine(1518)-N(6)/adenine(1519)-N(6))-dimethyltransferase RsmA [Clostridia bacterium]|nr:16S rRNA (adenine(1518)-N(6)/adenine(1519)-N(6))-dimethyltransferase RsmA [Clostridia bacterium]